MDTEASVERQPESIPEYKLAAGLALVESWSAEELARHGRAVTYVGGGSATGKSMAAERLAETFGDQLLVIPTDNYYLGRKAMRNTLPPEHANNFDHPGAIDVKLLAEHLACLKDGLAIEMPSYDFQSGERAGTHQVAAKPVIVVEGLYALDQRTDTQDGLGIYFNVDLHGRLIRRLVRDPERTGQKVQDILQQIAESVEPMQQQFVEDTRKKANLVINNEYDAEREAQRIGKYEYQVKYRGAVDTRVLEVSGAEYLGSAVQTDYFYTNPHLDLRTTDEILRIRHEPNNHLSLTYKGPEQRSGAGMRVRPKLEFSIDSALRAKLEELYCRANKIIIKSRHSYRLGGVLINCDTVTRDRTELGKFTELQMPGGADAERINEVAEVLGLSRPDTRPYYHL